MTKKTAEQTRIDDYCEFITDRFRYSDHAVIVVEWKKSRTWGMCPATMRGETKVATATGYGYCKLSTVLANTLAPLCADPAAIYRTAGAGVPSVQRALEAQGYKLQEVAEGSMFDAYHLTVLAPAEES